MDEKTALVLKKSFREYYFKNSEKVDIPDKIDEREFGYMPFGGSMIRHLTFKSPGEVIATLVREGPSAFFASTGYYKEPSMEMNKKGWTGADLVFDIDADQIPTSCKLKHDLWTCKECKHQEKGLRPQICKCGSTRMMQLNMVCTECLSEAKTETFKLIDFLINDFGVNKSDIKIYFSGNMGYHISIESTMFCQLDQAARNEIVDYLSGMGLIPESVGVYKGVPIHDIYSRIPLETEPGWRGRIAEHFQRLHIDDYNEIRGRSSRDKIAFLYGKMNPKKFKKMYLDKAVKKISVNIDSSVTTDIHRIFRMPGTLNGKSGLLKMECVNLESFDPLIDPVVFDDNPITVKIIVSSEFTLNECIFRTKSGDKVSLPKMAAIFLLTKGLARIE